MDGLNERLNKGLRNTAVSQLGNHLALLKAPGHLTPTGDPNRDRDDKEKQQREAVVAQLAFGDEANALGGVFTSCVSF